MGAEPALVLSRSVSVAQGGAQAWEPALARTSHNAGAGSEREAPGDATTQAPDRVCAPHRLSSNTVATSWSGSAKFAIHARPDDVSLGLMR